MPSSYSAFTPVPYDTRKLRQWSFGTENNLGGPAGKNDGSPHHAPFSQPALGSADKGYDTNATRLTGNRRTRALARANATVCDKEFYLPMFVNDVSIDIALSGSMAQSRFTRDFYPHNFVMPAFQISGQSLDQHDYGMLCEFVHQAQQKALAYGWERLTQIVIQGYGYDGTRSSGLAVHRSGEAPLGNQITRGSHKTIIAQGYVATMPREHERFVYAPTWDFGFIVAAMLQGPYTETLAAAKEQQTWVEMLQSIKTLDTKSLIKDDKKTLAWVAANSANVINDPGPPTGGSGGGTGSPTSGGIPGQAGNPAPGATWGRLDMGFDGDYGPAGAVAPYNGTIHGIGITGWPGQGTYFAILNDNQSGPDYTRAMYFAEGATPIYPNGTHVTAGQKIGNPVASGGTGAPGNFEIGPANTSNFDTLAKSYGLSSSGARQMIMAYYQWLRSNGAGASTDTSAAGGP